MRVELRDSYGQQLVIDSTNIDTIGRWFAEMVTGLGSVNTMFNHPVSLDIWPRTQDELDHIGDFHAEPLKSEDLREFAEKLWILSDELREVEWRASQDSSTTAPTVGPLWVWKSNRAICRSKYILPIKIMRSPLPPNFPGR